MKTEPNIAKTSSRPSGPTSVPAPHGITRLDVPVVDLLPDADNRIIDEEDEDFVTLSDSVRVMGILVALQVQRRADGKYQICDGERRWRAAQRAGLAQVPCDVWPETVHPRDLVLVGVVINEQRQAHSCLAVARRLRVVKNQFAETHEQVATRTGLPVGRVKSYLNLFNASDRLLAFFEDENVPLKTANELVKYEKALGDASTRSLLERLHGQPLGSRDIEILRKRRESHKKDQAPKPSSPPKLRTSSLAARIELAFARDAVAARKTLEAVAAKFGLRLIPDGVSSPGD